MQVIFWLSLLVIFYAYVGYPLHLWMRSQFRTVPVRTASIEPDVSIVIAAHNEALNLPRKLQNIASFDYPPDKLQVVVASDGSTDDTNNILQQPHGINLLPVFLEKPSGKPSALNAGVAKATGSIVMFMDARQTVAPDALRNLVRNFADPDVGCVSGELLITESGESTASAGVGLYWRIEKKVRQLESAVGSVVGATGAIYAVRRDLIPVLPAPTLLDDVLTPMSVARAGKRVIFEPESIAWDKAESSTTKEFKRKVRTLTGNYQLVKLAPWLLSPKNPLLFEFISHKLLRLVVPFALLAAFITCLLLPGQIFRWLLCAQLALYLMGVLGLFIKARILSFISSFLVLNAAAAMAFVNMVAGRMDVWDRRK